MEHTALVVVGAHHFGRDRNDNLHEPVAKLEWSRVLLVEANPGIATMLAAEVRERNPTPKVQLANVRVVNQGVIPADGPAETTLNFFGFDRAPGLKHWATQIGAFNRKHVEK